MLVDRYLARRLAIPFASVLMLVIATLLLEHLSRLMPMLGHVREPVVIMARFVAFLLPEYAAIGLLVALFLAVALCVRGLALSGEWEAFESSGLSPLRLLAVPMFLALACSVAELGLLLYLQPIGEQRLDRLGADIHKGRYGIGAEAGEMLELGGSVAIQVDSVDPRTGALVGVFIRSGDEILTARHATIHYDAEGSFEIALEQGQAFSPRGDGQFYRVAFQRFALTTTASPGGANSGPAAGKVKRRQPLSERLRRMPLPELLDRIARERVSNKGTKAALASLSSRLAYAWGALLLPFVAFSLSALPPRGRSAAGIAAGLFLIVLFVKIVAWIELGCASHPVLAFTAFLAASTLATLGLWRHEIRCGPGRAEAVLDRILLGPVTAWAGRIHRIGRRAAPVAPKSTPLLSPRKGVDGSDRLAGQMP